MLGVYALVLLPVVALSYGVRTIVVLLLHDRAPAVAAAVDRWWAWAPLVVVLVFLTLVHPVLGIVGAIAMYVVLTGTRALGSPFRPRR